MLDRLSAQPRFAGSVEEALARDVCRSELERAGFSCRDLPFEFSEWPGRWGPPALALAQVVTIWMVVRMELIRGSGAALPFATAIGFILFIVMTYAKRRWVLNFGLMRSSAVNLEAARGSPKLWLVAHIDSKSQTIPMLFRVVGSLALSLVVTLSVALVIASALRTASLSASQWVSLIWVAVIAALPTIFCWVGNGSNGALDNATGVAAVLLAASMLPRDKSLGVLITSGEELGLAGAREWARTARPDVLALNCDTFDDTGSWRSMSNSRAAPLQKMIDAAARELGYHLRTGRLIPGILADSVAFADAGMESVTLSRGTLSTLARIHTARDTSTALTGKGVAEASRLLSAIGRQEV